MNRPSAVLGGGREWQGDMGGVEKLSEGKGQDLVHCAGQLADTTRSCDELSRLIDLRMGGGDRGRRTVRMAPLRGRPERCPPAEVRLPCCDPVAGGALRRRQAMVLDLCCQHRHRLCRISASSWRSVQKHLQSQGWAQSTVKAGLRGVRKFVPLRVTELKSSASDEQHERKQCEAIVPGCR